MPAPLVEALSIRQTARRLVLSPRTVERHLANLYEKLGVRGRAEAVAQIVHHGFTPPASPSAPAG